MTSLGKLQTNLDPLWPIETETESVHEINLRLLYICSSCAAWSSVRLLKGEQELSLTTLPAFGSLSPSQDISSSLNRRRCT